jgi:hypothetical protein
LVEGSLDTNPALLQSSARIAFAGYKPYGMGFTFDDVPASRGEASSIQTMKSLVSENPKNAERIFPFIGGEEVNSHPTQACRRFVINFEDFPQRRDSELAKWFLLSETERETCIERGAVPADYPGKVASDWPELLAIIKRLVKPDRDKQTRLALRKKWWQYGERRPGLTRALIGLEHVLVITQTSPHLTISRLPSGMIYDQKLIVVAREGSEWLTILQSRSHEVWARTFGATLEDRLSYTPTDCFGTFPFPTDFCEQDNLMAAAVTYLNHRASIMISHNQGLTKTYNRFHDVADNQPDIVLLRELHSTMDRQMLRAYHWHDLADGAAPEFLDETNEDDHRYRGRLFWPGPFRDVVLSRLLALNAERAAEARAAGLAVQHTTDDAFETESEDSV